MNGHSRTDRKGVGLRKRGGVDDEKYIFCVCVWRRGRSGRNEALAGADGRNGTRPPKSALVANFRAGEFMSEGGRWEKRRCQARSILNSRLVGGHWWTCSFRLELKNALKIGFFMGYKDFGLKKLN